MTQTRKVVLWTALAAIAIGGLGAILPAFISPGRADTADVVSIKASNAYQEPLLLRKAWQLPVAKSYQTGIEYQRNGSVCGPTSVANVLHSLDQPGNQE